MKSKEKNKVLGHFNGSFLSNHVGGGHSFLISLKGANEKKGNSGSKPFSNDLKLLLT